MHQGARLPQNDLLKKSCSSFFQGLARWSWLALLVSLALAAAAVYYTFANLTFSTSRRDLTASNQRLIRLTDKMDQAFGGHDGLVVVVQNQKRAQSIDFAKALAVELRGYPDQFVDLFYRLPPDTFKPWALLYLDQNDLQKIDHNIAGQQKLLAAMAANPRLAIFYEQINRQIAAAMIGNLFTGFLDEKKKAELPNVALLNATLEQLLHSLGGQPYVSPFNSVFPERISDLSEEGYFFTDNDIFLMFLVTQKPGPYTTSVEHLRLLREVVRRVQARFPGIQAGVTGPDALEADEMGSSMKDIALATWISLAGQFTLLVLFLRSLRRALVEVLALIIGLCWTFGWVTLAVGHLNLLSLIFAPLMLGLAIDYGIHWFARLEEEETTDQRCTYEAMSCAYRQTLPAIVYAGLAAMISFLPLAFMNFRGLAELGLILTIGIVIMLLATLLLAPSLVMITEKCLPAPTPHRCPGEVHPFMQLRWRRPGWIVALGVLIIAIGVYSLFRVKFDLNPLHLQNPHTESVVWELKLLKESKFSTSFGALMTPSLEELQAKTETLEKLRTVSHVESVLSFLPDQVEAKRAILEKMQPVLQSLNFPAAPAASSTPQELAEILSRINFKMDEAAKNLEKEKAATQAQLEETHLLINKIIPVLMLGEDSRLTERLAEFEGRFIADFHDKWDLLRRYVSSALKSPPMTIADLPPKVRERFIYHGNYLLRVFPSQDIWDFGPLKKFVKSLWSVDPNAVGDPVLLYVFTLGFRNSILLAAGVALLAITFTLMIIYRSIKMALLALVPLWVGTGLTLIVMQVLGLAFNQANVLFLPLILGEGIEFGIIILTRWQLEEKARWITLPASTAKGVALAALTTTVGFGSLMVSGHYGTFSLGLLATVGSLSVLLASLSILPAFLSLLESRLHPPSNLFFSLFSSRPAPGAAAEKEMP
jgi:uncharacterized protein